MQEALDIRLAYEVQQDDGDAAYYAVNLSAVRSVVGRLGHRQSTPGWPRCLLTPAVMGRTPGSASSLEVGRAPARVGP
jgi:hypothetical protein